MSRNAVSKALAGASITIMAGLIGYSLLAAYRESRRTAAKAENHPKLSYSQAIEVQKLMDEDAKGIDVWQMAWRLFYGDLAEHADSTITAMADDYVEAVPNGETAIEWALSNRRWITEEFVVATAAVTKTAVDGK